MPESRTKELNRARELGNREQARLRLIFDSVPMGIALRTVGSDGKAGIMMNDVQWEICELEQDQDETSVFFDITHLENSVRMDRGSMERHGVELIGYPRREGIELILRPAFPPRKGGHAFGLHSSALFAQEMGATLRIESDGAGFGARFILELPRYPNQEQT